MGTRGGKDRRESTVGVRELRQNLSVYLHRVKAGETLDVTEHGRRVARLIPDPQGMPPYDRMIADGRITRGTGHLAEIGSPPPRGPGRSLSDVLGEMREEERA